MTVTQTEATATTQWAASSAAAMWATQEREPWALVKVCVCAQVTKKWFYGELLYQLYSMYIHTCVHMCIIVLTYVCECVDMFSLETYGIYTCMLC